ncbi:hypothetical protein ABHF33_13910 [Chitinibacter sp. FCG-7]|uniref:Phage holin family protein n=1 Tax=Chitinibacter mangrovi TaxID=3153927 RepID=A0AAU7F8G3_9NEIS
MSLSIEANGLIPTLVIFSAVMVMPIKWAAAYVDAGRTDFAASLLAVVLSVIASVISFKLLGGGFIGFLVALVVMNIVQAIILKISAYKIPGYFIIAIFLQLAISFFFATMPIKF